MGSGSPPHLIPKPLYKSFPLLICALRICFTLLAIWPPAPAVVVGEKLPTSGAAFNIPRAPDPNPMPTVAEMQRGSQHSSAQFGSAEFSATYFLEHDYGAPGDTATIPALGVGHALEAPKLLPLLLRISNGWEIAASNHLLKAMLATGR